MNFEDMPPVLPQKRLAHCVRNNQGDLLAYTVQSYQEQVHNRAEELWGAETWTRLQELGARVVMIEVTLVDCYHNREALL